MNKYQVSALLVGFLVIGCLREAIAESLEQANRIGEVLWWLPEDTQTLIVARGPFTMEGDIFLLQDFRRMTSAHIPSPVFGNFELGRADEEEAAKRKADEKRFARRLISLSVQGSRRFRAPRNVGAMGFEGASITVFTEPLGEDWKSLWNISSKNNATRAETILGEKVLVFERKEQQDRRTYYLVQPKPDVLVLATNRPYLEAVLRRMAKRAKTRALPESLPEWKHLDMSKPLWAVRHYDRKDGPNDPTSPLAGAEKAANDLDDQAIGLVFTFDPAKKDLAIVKYLSNNNNAMKIAEDSFSYPDEDLIPDVRLDAPGVVEIFVSLQTPQGAKKTNAAGMFFLLILQQLGHGVAL